MLKLIIASAIFLLPASTGFSQGHYLKGALSYGVQKEPNYYFSKPNYTVNAENDHYELNYFYQLGYVKEKSGNKSLEILLGGNPGHWRTQYYPGISIPTKIGNTLAGNVHVQMEVKKSRWFDEKRKSSAYLGSFLNLGYDYQYFKTAYNSFYSSTIRTSKAKMGIVPGARIGYGKRMVIDFNIAVSLISFGFESSRIENPDLSESAQKSRTFKMDLPMETILRVGVAYRI